MKAINLYIDLARINDEKTISWVSLVEYVLVLFDLGQDHRVGDLLDFLIFEGGKELMFRKAFEGKLDLLFLKFIPQDGYIFWNVICDHGWFATRINEFRFSLSQSESVRLFSLLGRCHLTTHFFMSWITL